MKTWREVRPHYTKMAILFDLIEVQMERCYKNSLQHDNCMLCLLLQTPVVLLCVFTLLFTFHFCVISWGSDDFFLSASFFCSAISKFVIGQLWQIQGHWYTHHICTSSCCDGMKSQEFFISFCSCRLK